MTSSSTLNQPGDAEIPHPPRAGKDLIGLLRSRRFRQLRSRRQQMRLATGFELLGSADAILDR